MMNIAQIRTACFSMQVLSTKTTTTFNITTAPTTAVRALFQMRTPAQIFAMKRKCGHADLEINAPTRLAPSHIQQLTLTAGLMNQNYAATETAAMILNASLRMHLQSHNLSGFHEDSFNPSLPSQKNAYMELHAPIRIVHYCTYQMNCRCVPMGMLALTRIAQKRTLKEWICWRVQMGRNAPTQVALLSTRRIVMEDSMSTNTFPLPPK